MGFHPKNFECKAIAMLNLNIYPHTRGAGTESLPRGLKGDEKSPLLLALHTHHTQSVEQRQQRNTHIGKNSKPQRRNTKGRKGHNTHLKRQ